MASADWNVLVFGDSWADYFVPTWPLVLARRLGATPRQHAQAGSVVADLNRQMQQCLLNPATPKAAGGMLKAETLVVVHTCGNDLIGKMAPIMMGGGALDSLEILQPNPGQREAAKLLEFLENMYKAGARNFLVSGVPLFIQMPVFNLAMGIVQGFVNAGKLEALGISPGDPAHLALEVQGLALHDLWCDMCSDFNKRHPDAHCIFFDEVAALHKMRDAHGAAIFDRSMWDMTMFHPSPWGHEQLASEAHRVVTESFPKLASLNPHPEAKTPKAAEDVASKPEPIQVKVRNVKGDVNFTVDADSKWRVTELREGVLNTSPPGFRDTGKVCVLALNGKFLEDGPRTLADMGIASGTQVIAVMKAQPAVSGGYAAKS
eukprot:TRINITY_DN15333_c0_g2_i1.p1 TRINITY_DN15333_c0_g2~~TRINITY_DN15333_c0_g2_i1.p1  ORF type:complete len:375 (+),score=51.83 TRINITY_DN15333_c0_g2_i1:69-1193(+)